MSRLGQILSQSSLSGETRQVAFAVPRQRRGDFDEHSLSAVLRSATDVGGANQSIEKLPFRAFLLMHCVVFPFLDVFTEQPWPRSGLFFCPEQGRVSSKWHILGGKTVIQTRYSWR